MICIIKHKGLLFNIFYGGITMKTEELKMVSEWDKTFPKSEKVEHRKITFVNRYGITLAADMYTPNK